MDVNFDSRLKYLVPRLKPMPSSRPSPKPLSYSEIRNLVIGRVHANSPKARATVELARNTLTEPKLADVLEGIFIATWQNPDKRPFRSLAVRRYQEFKPERAYGAVPLAKELVWCSTLLQWHSHTLKRFVHLSTAFGDALLGGQTEKAAGLLSEIEQEVGLSMWLIEANLLYLQSQSGLEAQKEFASELSNVAPDSFAAFVAHYVSQRNENSVTIARFNSRFAKYAAGWNISQSFRDYIIYRVTGELPGTRRGLASLLRIDAEMSIVDLYETAITVIHHLLSNGHPSLLGTIQDFLGTLAPTDDFRIGKLSLLANSGSIKDIDFQTRPRDPENALWAGDLDDAIAKADITLSTSPCDASAISVKAHAVARGAESQSQGTGITQNVISALSGVIAKGPSYLSALSETEKLAVNLRVLPLSNLLREHVAREAAKQPDNEAQFLRIGMLASPLLTPIDAAGLPESLQTEYLKACVENYGTNNDVIAALVTTGHETEDHSYDGDGENFDLARLRHAVLSGELQTAYDLAVSLGRSEDNVVRHEAAASEVFCLLERADLNGVLTRITEICLEDSGMLHALPLERALRGRKFHELAPFAQSLSTAIALDLYLQLREDEEQEYNLRAVWDEFLFKHGVKLASELVSSAGGFDKNQLVYFLAAVCNLQVMDISLDLDGTKALFEERIKICSILVELDPENAEEYQEEIVAISKELKLQEGLQLFDRSRVHVDTDALVRWADRELRETFNRYKALLDAGITTADTDFDEAIRDYLQSRNPIPERFMELPKGAGDHLLIEIVESIRERFLNDPEHGLDCFLSMRVRHGSLSGVLRGPVEQRELVTVRDSSSMVYKSNEVWRSRLAGMGDEHFQSLDKAFMEFSESYDSIIQNLNTNIMRVRSSDAPAGAFHVEINGLSLRYLKGKISEGTGFEGFISDCILEITGLLQPCLDKVRRILREDVKQQISNAFQKLQADITTCLDGCVYTDLKTALAEAFTDAQTSLARIADWFGGGVNVVDGVNFTMDEIIDVAVDVTKNTRSGFLLEPQRDVRVQALLGPSVFREMVDILFVIFGNIHDRSMVKEQPWVKLSSWQDDTGMLKLRVESQVAENVYSQEREDELARIRAILDSDAYRSRVGTEVNSGFFKIKRTVAAHARHGLRFGYMNPTAFFVEAEMSLLYEVIIRNEARPEEEQ